MPNSPSQRPDPLVPARYIGHFAARLRPRRGGYKDASGAPRTGPTALLLEPGQTLMLPESELRGATFLVDPSGLAGEAEWLGAGFTPLPQHAGLDRDSLIGLRFPRDGASGPPRMYQFHDGRSDFQEIDAPWPPPSDEPEPAASAETSESAPALASAASSAAAVIEDGSAVKVVDVADEPEPTDEPEPEPEQATPDPESEPAADAPAESESESEPESESADADADASDDAAES